MEASHLRLLIGFESGRTARAGGDGARRFGRVGPAANPGSTTMGPRVRFAPTGLSTGPDRRTLRAGAARAPGRVRDAYLEAGNDVSAALTTEARVCLATKQLASFCT
jgi:hypothetical protein